MIYLSEQVILIVLEAELVLYIYNNICVGYLKVIVKNHGHHTYLQETMKSFKPDYYANSPLSS